MRDKYAIRVDDLPETPGVRLVLLNVVDPDMRPPTSDLLTAIPLMLRYSWRNTADLNQLLNLYVTAVSQKSRVGDILDWVKDQVMTLGTPTPIDRIPDVVRNRQLGVATP
jgi:hypothetical protein